MENAISLSATELPGLKPAALRGYDRVYIGSEFCQNRLPSAAAFLGLARIFKGPLTLVTPLLSDSGLDGAAALIKAVGPAKGKPLEVVVNDWGLLRLLEKNRRVRPVLGRLLMWEIAGMDKKFFNAFCRFFLKSVLVIINDGNLWFLQLLFSDINKTPRSQPDCCRRLFYKFSHNSPFCFINEIIILDEP